MNHYWVYIYLDGDFCASESFGIECENVGLVYQSISDMFAPWFLDRISSIKIARHSIEEILFGHN